MDDKVIYKVPGTSKEYELRLEPEDIERFESVCDLGLWGLYQKLVTGNLPKHGDAVKLFWATARSKNPQWSLKLARDLVPPRDYPVLLGKLVELLKSKLVDPEAQPGEGSGDERPLAATSTPSAG